MATWLTNEEARTLWVDAPPNDATLSLYLEAAKVAVLEYAPDLAVTTGEIVPGDLTVYRNNLVINPSFATGSGTQWNPYWSPARSISTTEFYPGGSGKSLQITRSTDARTNQGVNTLNSAALSGVAGTRHMIIRIKGAVGANLLIGFRTSSGLATGGTTVTGDGTWKELEFTSTSTSAIGIQVNVTNSNTFTEGQPMFWVDSALIELDTTGTYFDGSTVDQTIGGVLYDFAWTGAESLSTSVQTYRPDVFVVSIPEVWRLAQIMQARNIWNAGKEVGGSTDLSGSGYGLTTYPLDNHIRQMLRPKRALGFVA